MSKSRECLIYGPMLAHSPFKTLLPHSSFGPFTSSSDHFPYLPSQTSSISTGQQENYSSLLSLSLSLSMTPTYLSLQPFPFALELNEDQHHQLFSPKPQADGSSSSSSLSYPIFFDPTQDQEGCYHGELQQLHHQQEAEKYGSSGGLYDHATLENERDDNGLKLAVWKKEDRNENQNENSIGSVKWMSSKIRLMRKMMNVDQMGVEIPNNLTQKFSDPKQPSSSLEADNSSNSTIRVCADCNTTKTPLWRSGPRGPKSLCNACGIRQRKARRAMAAAAAAANGTITVPNTPSMKPKLQKKDKKSSNGYTTQHKKRCKLVASPSRGRKKLCFEDFTISLSKNSAFQRVFPQDEKDAAILLMALSYGLVHG